MGSPKFSSQIILVSTNVISLVSTNVIEIADFPKETGKRVGEGLIGSSGGRGGVARSRPGSGSLG